MPGFDNLLEIFLVALLGFSGIYALYSVIRLNKECFLFPNRFLYPANCKPEDCTDVPGFIAYITPRLLIFGIACLALGLFLALCWMVKLITLPTWMDFAVPVLGVAIFAWYIAIQNKVYKLFW